MIGASGYAVGRVDSSDGIEPVSLRMSVNEQAEERGNLLMEEIRWAVARFPDAVGVRKLARIAQEAPELLLRVPESVELLDRLSREGNEAALGRILGAAQRGRPVKRYLPVIAVIDALCHHLGCSVAKASSIAADRYGRHLHMDAPAIQNAYSEHRRLYHAVTDGYFVREDVLTTTPWQRKEDR